MQQRRNSGFTLVEVMIGVGVFTVAMLSVFLVYSQAIDNFAATRDTGRVSQTMQYQMETIRGMQWDTFVAQAALTQPTEIKVDDNGIPTDGNAKVPYDWKAFKLMQSIVQEKVGHYRVDLTADWTDAESRKHQRVMKTWLSEDGLNDYYTRSTN